MKTLLQTRQLSPMIGLSCLVFQNLRRVKQRIGRRES